MKFEFFDSQNQNHPFWIDNYNIDNYYHNFINDPLFVIELRDLKDGAGRPYSYEVYVYKYIDSFKIDWDEGTIAAYAHIKGYKEFIDKTVKLLIFG